MGDFRNDRILLMFLLVVVAVFLILLILIQRGRGGGLAGAFGATGGQSAFGTKAGDVFTRITIGTAAVWILLCAASVKILGSGETRFDQRLGGRQPDSKCHRRSRPGCRRQTRHGGGHRRATDGTAGRRRSRRSGWRQRERWWQTRTGRRARLRPRQSGCRRKPLRRAVRAGRVRRDRRDAKPGESPAWCDSEGTAS